MLAQFAKSRDLGTSTAFVSGQPQPRRHHRLWQTFARRARTARDDLGHTCDRRTHGRRGAWNWRIAQGRSRTWSDTAVRVHRPRQFGVDLFFVVSGFILAHISYAQLSEPAYAKHFIIRRIARVVRSISST